MHIKAGTNRTKPTSLTPQAWSAVGSMTLCVAMLIASEFMPVSLLTPIAADLKATEGMAGQAISISGLFAVITSLFIANIAGRFNRKHVLTTLTAFMLLSLILIASAPNFVVLMAARALLGITIGGFWALSTATIMRLVPDEAVPQALGLLYTSNAATTAFAAPIGSFLGGIIGWRGVFWALVPIALVSLVWQWRSLPALTPQRAIPVLTLVNLVRDRSVALAMGGLMLTFGGAFMVFTYFRPFLESTTQVSVPQLSMMLLALGMAGFLGTYGASRLVGRHLRKLLVGLPLALGAINLAMIEVGHSFWGIALFMCLWGTVNSAIPVTWSTWQTRELRHEPEAGGGLMVAVIQLSIMLGAAGGGLLLDHLSIAATFAGGVVLLVLAAMSMGFQQRVSRAGIVEGSSTGSAAALPVES